MKVVFFLGACAVLLTTPALACRGTVEYPEVMALLAKADIPEERKQVLADRLTEGKVLHDKGHDMDSQELRLKSLAVLDEIRVEISK
jgi:hypothetical protein